LVIHLENSHTHSSDLESVITNVCIVGESLLSKEDVISKFFSSNFELWVILTKLMTILRRNLHADVVVDFKEFQTRLEMWRQNNVPLIHNV